MTSTFVFRLPGSKEFIYGSAQEPVEGLHKGFIISKFWPEESFLTIPVLEFQHSGSLTEEMFPSLDKNIVDEAVSTSREDYFSEVESIIKDLNGDISKKVVAARVLKETGNLNLKEKFDDLANRFPEAYVFCFFTPATGCWIGASPELLLKASSNKLSTMALAGTRPLNDQELSWDQKNKEEQKIVTEFISKTLSNEGLEVKVGDTFTKKAGSVEHICTPISATVNRQEDFLSAQKLEKLLHLLSPTPALCGHPKEFALKEIERLEKFNREGYGGFSGAFISPSDFSFYVTIRCAKVFPDSYNLYVGGGITPKSDPISEFQETSLKLSQFIG